MLPRPRALFRPKALLLLSLFTSLTAASFYAAHAHAEGGSAKCDHKLRLPILVPRALYDLHEFCGGEITVF